MLRKKEYKIVTLLIASLFFGRLCYGGFFDRYRSTAIAINGRPMFNIHPYNIDSTSGYLYEFNYFIMYKLLSEDANYFGDVRNHSGFTYLKDDVVHFIPYVRGYSLVNYPLFDLNAKLQQDIRMYIYPVERPFPIWPDITVTLIEKKISNQDTYYKYSIDGISEYRHTSIEIVFGLRQGPIGIETNSDKSEPILKVGVVDLQNL